MTTFLKPMFITVSAGCLSQSIPQFLSGRVHIAIVLLVLGGLAFSALVKIWSVRS